MSDPYGPYRPSGHEDSAARPDPYAAGVELPAHQADAFEAPHSAGSAHGGPTAELGHAPELAWGGGSVQQWAAPAPVPGWAGAPSAPQPGASIAAPPPGVPSYSAAYAPPPGFPPAPLISPWAVGVPVRGNPGTLDLPWYGIGFVDAIKRAFAKAFVFSGRASLGEYWWLCLFNGIVFVGCYALMLGAVTLTVPQGVPQDSTPAAVSAGVTLFAIAYVVLGWVTFVTGIRRLHDAGQSGWLWLISIVPFGGIVLLVLLASGPKPEGARFDKQDVNAFVAQYRG